MESMGSLNPTLGFDCSHDGEAAEPLIQIGSQESQFDQALTIEPIEPIPRFDQPPPDPTSQSEASDAVAAAAAAAAAAASDVGPDKPAAHEPVLNMEFESAEAARAFYSAYAERVGFRVRNSKSFTSRVDDTVIMRRFVCSRQGRPSKKDPFDLSKKRRNRASSREGCRAMLQVNRRPDSGFWAVSRCVLDHCHPLGIAPKPSPTAQRKLAKKPWELLLCGLTTTDSHHHQQQQQQQQNGLGPGGGVAQSLLEYFKKMQAENPAFFYAIQVDRNNCLANVFWADARARMAYSYFGDAIVLDMTCKRNKRVVPLAAFRGLNHHRQLVVFGSAFMTDESEESFIWLFETWLALMSGRRPVSFVTAYNEAMESAALKVFSNVRHRFCKQDIFNKCKEKLDNVYTSYATFKGEFKRCVNESESIEEFESGWKSLMERYNLVDNIWLHSLYDIREKWVPVYLRGTFFAELPRAAKLETMQKFFQRHSITTTTLRDLVTQFDKAMAGQYEKEVQADTAMINTRPVLKTPSPMEKQASEIYTRAIFDLFQEELVESSGFLMDKMEDNGVMSKFRVAKIEDSSKAHIVTYHASEKAIRCTCCMFEFSGILCRHVFRVFLVVGILTLPEDYISRRWTKNAKSNILSYEHCGVLQSSCQRAVSWRCNDLCRDAIRYAEEGATSAMMYKVAKGALQKAFSEVFAAKRGPFFNEASNILLRKTAADVDLVLERTPTTAAG